MSLHPFKASYLILPDSKLIIEVITGSITLNFYTSYELQLVKDSMYNPSYNVFVDMREVVFDGTIDQMNQYATFILENNHIIQNRKNATLIHNLHQHSYVQLFDKFNEQAQLSQEFKLVFSLKEAIDWLAIPFNENELESMISEMKKNPQFFGVNPQKF